MLKWIVWNRTVFDIETVCKQNTMHTINLIVWNRTVYMYKNGFGIKYLVMVDMPWSQIIPMTQSAGAVEYTDSFSAQG